jgi:ABC-type multidrug transport system ATPase subunit
MNAPLLTVRDLCVTYDQWGTKLYALRKVNLEMFPGEWISISGPNGSGKSTLLRALCGEVPTSGTILFAAGVNERKCYSVKQDPVAGTSGTLTVFENLWVLDESAPLRRSAAREKYGALLEPAGLESKLNQRVEELSGGQRQILAVLMAALTSHALVLLDEPTTALDAENEERCIAIMQKLSKAGRCLLHVSHEPQHRVLANRSLFLDKGCLVPQPSSSPSVQPV